MHHRRRVTLGLLAVACLGLPACSIGTGQASAAEQPQRTATTDFCAKLNEEPDALVRGQAVRGLTELADAAPADIRPDTQTVVRYWRGIAAGDIAATDSRPPTVAIQRITQWQNANCPGIE